MPASPAKVADSGRVAEALELLRRGGSSGAHERLLHCELEALAGNRPKALELANGILARDAPPAVAARALTVVGREAISAGRHAEGHAAFHRALGLASESSDPKLVALILGRQIETLLHFIGLEPASAFLGAFRRASNRAGDSESLHALHRLLAETEIGRASCRERVCLAV